MRVERLVQVPNELGLHVRPAAAVAETAAKFESRVQIQMDGHRVNAKSSIDLLTLAATQGTNLTITAEGADASSAVDAVANLIQSGFGEK